MSIETRYNLDTSKSLTLTAQTGTIQLGPVGPHCRWEINRYSSASGQSCNVSLYKNAIVQSNYLDGTLVGDNDSGGIQITLYQGESLWFYYENGVVGDIVTALIYGDVWVRGDRGYGSSR